MSNTHPSTPFGHFFNWLGIWQPTAEEFFKSAYDKLHVVEQEAAKNASSWIGIINENLDKAPDFVFDILHSKFPSVTKESIAAWLLNVNTKIGTIDASVPQNFETGIAALQAYLGKYTGNTWISLTKAVVSVGADVLLNGTSPIQGIETVLEYVYQTFVKGKVVK